MDENPSEEFQQTIFNPNKVKPKKSSDHVLYFKKLPRPKADREGHLRNFD